MLNNTSRVTLDNLKTDDIIGLFISGIGEVICKISEVTETDVHVSHPYRFIIQDQGIGLAPIGSLAAIAEQQTETPPDISFNRNQIVYPIKLPQDIQDAYNQQISGIETVRGDVNNIINPSQK